MFQFIKQWKDTLIVRFKIIVAHFQIVTTFPSVLDVQWPESFNRCAGGAGSMGCAQAFPFLCLLPCVDKLPRSL